MQVFQYFQILFIAVFVIVFAVRKAQEKSESQIRKEIFNFAVIPSLAFTAVGHLILGPQIREGMGWDDSVGTVTLERELGITQLSLFIVACMPHSSPETVASLWGLMLVMMGVNHFVVERRISPVGLSGVVYGGLLVLLYGPEIT